MTSAPTHRLTAKILAVLLTAIGTTPLAAQDHQVVSSLKTKAHVVSSDGRITYYSGSDHLSFDRKSFLTVKIGNKLYTNSDQPPAGTEPLPVSLQSKEGDTVSNQWSLPGVKFVQRVFPQHTNNGLKIATRFLASKTGISEVSLGCQYLLDINLSGADDSPVLYHNDYLDKQSKKYSGSVPSYLILSEQGLPNPPSYDPGLVAMVIYKDELNPQIDPSLLIVGHWPDLERIPYVSAQYVPQPTILAIDVGIVSQWPERVLVTDSLSVIGEFAYGAADYTTCVGKLFAMMFIPDEITERSMLPDRTIDAPFYIFNPDPAKDYQATITVRVDDALRLKGMEEYSNLTTYPARSYKHFSLPLILDTTSTASTAEITLVAPSPMFLDACEAIVKVKRIITDDVRPSIVNLTRANNDNDCTSRRDTIVVTDKATGLASIELQASGHEVRYLTDGKFPSISQTLEFQVKDTLRSSSAMIRAIDQAGNTMQYQLKYCPLSDTLTPYFIVTFNGKDAWDILVTESRPWDALLNRILFTDAMNTSFSELTNSFKEDSALLRVQILDPSQSASICLSAFDIASNRADTCLTYSGPSSVTVESKRALTLVPNPAADVITLSGMTGEKISITDILGNTITNFHRISETTISVSDLPSGRYFLFTGESHIPFTIER